MRYWLHTMNANCDGICVTWQMGSLLNGRDGILDMMHARNCDECKSDALRLSHGNIYDEKFNTKISTFPTSYRLRKCEYVKKKRQIVTTGMKQNIYLNLLFKLEPN